MHLKALEPARQIAPAGAQRVRAKGCISVSFDDGRTRLRDLHQEGAARIRMPRGAGQSLEAILINTAGGLTGGDRIDWHVETGRGASALVTTQACEKIQGRSRAGRNFLPTRCWRRLAFGVAAAENHPV